MTLRHWERARPLRNMFVDGRWSIKAVQCKPQAPFVVRKSEAHRGRRRTRLCLLYFRWHGTRYRSRGIPRPRNPKERSARHRRIRRLVQDSRANCWDTWTALGPFIGHAILISHASLCGMYTPCPNSIWIPWVRCPLVRKTLSWSQSSQTQLIIIKE